MWDSQIIARIEADPKLSLPQGFISELKEIEQDWSHIFNGLETPDTADPFFFSAASSDWLSLSSFGFIPFWQENQHNETFLIGCAEPFLGCIGAQGILMNESGGLISGNFRSFFKSIRELPQSTAQRNFGICDICDQLAYRGHFPENVSDHADAAIRNDPEGSALLFYGAMSPKLAMELLKSKDFLEVEVACWRLRGLDWSAAITELEKIAKTKVEPGMTDQHIRAASLTLSKLRSSLKKN